MLGYLRCNQRQSRLRHGVDKVAIDDEADFYGVGGKGHYIRECAN